MPVGRVMFRLEAFNAFNRVRFSLPSNDFNATTFGRITGQLNTSRQIQVGLRYIF